MSRFDSSFSAWRACNTCGNRTIDSSSPAYVNKCKTCYRKEKENTTYRECSVCGVCNIPSTAESYKTTCGTCYKKQRADYVECSNCGKKNITMQDAANTNLCKSCKPTGPMRLCGMCNSYKIDASKPDWQNKCYDCYKASK